MTNKIITLAEQILIILQALGRSFWNATTKTVWGIAGIFLLAGLIVTMKADASLISGLLDLSIVIMKYWTIFWTIFFMGDLYFRLKRELFNKW